MKYNCKYKEYGQMAPLQSCYGGSNPAEDKAEVLYDILALIARFFKIPVKNLKVRSLCTSGFNPRFPNEPISVLAIVEIGGQQHVVYVGELIDMESEAKELTVCR